MSCSLKKLNIRITSNIWILAQSVIFWHLDELAKPQIYYTLQLERSLLLTWGNNIEHWLRCDLLKPKPTWRTGLRNKDNQWYWQQLRNKLSTGLTYCTFYIINMNKYVGSNETLHLLSQVRSKDDRIWHSSEVPSGWWVTRYFFRCGILAGPCTECYYGSDSR